MAFESGLRAPLKDAIVARDLVIDRVEASKAAVERIEGQLFDAQRRLRETRVAAGEEQAARVQEIVAGGSATLLQRVNGTREADVEREITACKSARDLCKATLADAQVDLGSGERKVIAAIGSVLSGSASRLIAEEEQLRASLEGKRAILRYLRSSLGDDQRRRVDAMLPPSVGWVDDHPAVGPWKAAAEALTRDADAALPDA
jgi:hypothetical protein